VFLWFNVKRLISDKQSKGVNISTVMFWALWGAWNLFYYPHLNQWFSFAGGVSVMCANTTWVGMAIYYKYK
jgi:hypothetical protein